MTIYDTNEDGEIVIIFDSRWKNPETLGYRQEDPEYKLLRMLWKEATGKADSENETADEGIEALAIKD